MGTKLEMSGRSLLLALDTLELLAAQPQHDTLRRRERLQALMSKHLEVPPLKAPIEYGELYTESTRAIHAFVRGSFDMGTAIALDASAIVGTLYSVASPAGPAATDRMRLILWAYLRTFADGRITESDVAGPSDAPVDEELLGKLLQPVEQLECSVRLHNCLTGVGTTYVGQVVQYSEGEWLNQKNFGKKALRELKARLADCGLELGMEISGATLAEFKRRMDELALQAASDSA